MKFPFHILILFLFLLGSQVAGAQAVFNISDYGAVGDGHTINTGAIQAAIDACAKEGGGQVLVPKGTFLSGTIHLKSNVMLYLSVTGTIKGIVDLKAYTPLEYGKESALVTAYEQENIGITGPGTLYGNGEAAVFQGGKPANGIPGRPNLMHLRKCSNVKLNTFTARNGARWDLKVQECKQVTVDDIKVLSRVVANNDGLDLVDCHDVRVINSYFDCGDDALCPKSDTQVGCKNIVISNCIIKSESNGIKFGTSGVGGFEDITISNCVIYDTRLSGIALELVDGGAMDRVSINNITMHRVNGGIFIKLGSRKGKTGTLKNISISNVIADGIGSWQPDKKNKYFKTALDQRLGMTITGLPGHAIENISLENIRMQFAGGGSLEDAGRVMPETPKAYPEYSNFGITPAYGFTVRHAKNVRFSHVELSYAAKDERPALFFDDVATLRIDAFRGSVADTAPALIRLAAVSDAYIYNHKPAPSLSPFVLVSGSIADVAIANNDFSQIRNIIAGDEAAFKNVTLFNNLK